MVAAELAEPNSGGVDKVSSRTGSFEQSYLTVWLSTGACCD